MIPIAWTREHRWDSGKTSRIFVTTMGAATDLANAGLRRLIVNACYWTLDLPVPTSADVSFVKPFNPTPFGFNKFKPGVKPSAHALE
jgi:hypothetical protein